MLNILGWKSLIINSNLYLNMLEYDGIICFIELLLLI